jgi:hypothetical protein
MSPFDPLYRNNKHVLNKKNIGFGKRSQVKGVMHPLAKKRIFFDIDSHPLSVAWSTPPMRIT